MFDFDDLAALFLFAIGIPALIATWVVRSLTLHWLWGTWFDGSGSPHTPTGRDLAATALWTLSSVACWMTFAYVVAVSFAGV